MNRCVTNQPAHGRGSESRVVGEAQTTPTEPPPQERKRQALTELRSCRRLACCPRMARGSPASGEVCARSALRPSHSASRFCPRNRNDVRKDLTPVFTAASFLAENWKQSNAHQEGMGPHRWLWKGCSSATHRGHGGTWQPGGTSGFAEGDKLDTKSRQAVIDHTKRGHKA